MSIAAMESRVRNPFTQESEGRRYHLYRPHYHDIPFSLLQKRLPSLGDVLDVACGTGHSTSSLAKIAKKAVGIDISAVMLAEAKKYPGIEFIQAPAEDLPFPEGAFDLVHVSMALQWFDQSRFLKEAHRVLHSMGYLSIDNYGFTGQMQGAENFAEQFKEFDLKNFPPAPRNKNFLDDEVMKKFGFRLQQTFSYEHVVEMNSEQFTQYLMTRSNFLHLNFPDQERLGSLAMDYYRKLFNGQNQKLLFKGTLKLYQRDL